ncbi:nuclear protein DGCR14 [Nemania serpens]|nr:nuclear protein DGCR14 [Nemania serpens]
MEPDAKTSTALVRKRDDNLELMPPPPPPKRIKRPRKVISEDSYTDALSQIIARDFFPGLLESETQQEYLDALDSKDPEWISSAGRRLQHVMTPGRRRARRGTSLAPGSQTQTPRGLVAGDTPVSVSAESSAAASVRLDDDDVEPEIEIDTNMSLSAFQSKYTSEDNESFYRLLDKQNSRRAEKYAWLWAGNKLPSKMQLAQRRVETKLLEARQGLVDDGFAKKKDRLLAVKDRDDRPARPDTWRSVPNNALMFVPDAVADGTETQIQAAEAASRAPPKAVNYQNTRLPAPRVGDDPQSSIPPSPSLSAVRDAIAGRRRPGSEAATSTAAGGSETPRVNGYAFVDDADEQPEHETPGIGIDLGPGDATPNPFVIQAQSRREALHHSMVDRISQSRRASSRLGATGKVDTTTPVPRFPSSPRVTAGGLTPAAQRLWTKIGSSAGVTPRTPFGQGMPMRAGRGSKLKHVSK